MFGILEDHFDNPFPTTTQDLCRDQAYHLGRERPDQAWISTSWDTWEPNPFYQGPAEPHPELYDPEDDGADVPVTWGEGDEVPVHLIGDDPEDDSEEIPF